MTPDLPIGGTTGLCHEASAAVDEAGQWLARQGDMTGRAIVPELKTRFGLTALEAIEAIRASHEIRRRG